MTREVLAAWRQRFTEREEWRLTEHFFRALFDFGFLSDLAADSFKRVLIGSVGGFIAFGLLMTRAFMVKYAVLLGTGTPERYRRALLGDDMLIIGLPMLLVAFVTLLVSHSLFPDERDFRILGPLPVRRSRRFPCQVDRAPDVRGAVHCRRACLAPAADTPHIAQSLGRTQRAPQVGRVGHCQRRWRRHSPSSPSRRWSEHSSSLCRAVNSSRYPRSCAAWC